MNADACTVLKRRARISVIDVCIVATAMVCCAAPFIAVGNAADGPVFETPISVDQVVHPAAVISQPLSPAFTLIRDGRATGTVTWSVSTSDGNGFKLVLSSTTTPAMQGTGSATVADYSDQPSEWDVSGQERAFGFSVSGSRARSMFGNGTKWRGFDGKRGIEIARRRGSASEPVTTTVRLATEMGAALPAAADPQAHILATTVANI